MATNSRNQVNWSIKGILEFVVLLITLGGVIAYLESRFGKIEGILNETSNRVERIASSLPDQISIATNDYWQDRVKVIFTLSNETKKIKGKDFKITKFVDTKNGDVTKFAIPVSQFEKSHAVITNIAKEDQHSRNFYQIGLDVKTYLPKESFIIPSNIDPRESFALSKDPNEIIKQYKVMTPIIEMGTIKGTSAVVTLDEVEDKLNE